MDWDGAGLSARTEPGDRIYAIGDIHGCHHLLRAMLDRIGAHAQALPPPGALYIVFIGDVIDRGPDSAGVLAMLYDLQRQSDHIVVLLGNHEEAMLQALDGEPDALRRWVAVGGAETLRSFGVGRRRAGESEGDYLLRIRAAVPREWIAWLRRLPLSVGSGDYHFVHAGVRPGVALSRQSRTDMLWIREEFLDDASDHGAVIVHGHTIAPAVEMKRNRIGIDTGAYRTGMLSAVYLEGEQRQVLTVTEAAGGERGGGTRGNAAG